MLERTVAEGLKPSKAVNYAVMLEARPYSDVPLDAEGGISIAMRCRICGYNLMRQRLDGVCPECGTPVYETARTFRSDDLIYSDLKWLRSVALGAKLLVAGLGVAFCGWIVAAGMALALRPVGLMPPIGVLSVQWALNLTVAVLFLIGLILLTKRNPNTVELSLTARKCARLFAIALIVVWVGTIVLGIVSVAVTVATGPMALPPTWLFNLLMCCGALGFLVGTLLISATLRHMRNLMRAAAAPGIATFATVLFWVNLPVAALLGLGFLLLFTSLGPVFSMATNSSPTPPAGVTPPPGLPANGVYTTLQIAGSTTVNYSFVPPAGAATTYAPGATIAVNTSNFTMSTTGPFAAASGLPTASVTVSTPADAEDGERTASVTFSAGVGATSADGSIAPSTAPAAQVAVTTSSSSPTAATILATATTPMPITPGGQGTMAGTPGAVSVIVSTAASAPPTGMIVSGMLLGCSSFGAMGVGIAGIVLMIMVTAKLHGVVRECALHAGA